LALEWLTGHLPHLFDEAAFLAEHIIRHSQWVELLIFPKRGFTNLR